MHAVMAPKPEVPDTTDVVVVGGGIMGTSTAFFLTHETDLDVVLIEKNEIGSGSTGDSSAILRHHYGPDRIYTEMAAFSHDFYRSFEERTDEVIAHESNPVVRFVEAETQAGEDALSGYEVLSSLDLPVTKYSGQEVDDQYPMLDVDDVDIAVSDDSAGYSDGTDAAGGFSRAAQALGATVVTGVEVTDIQTEDDAIERIETTEGYLDTDSVVIAAGPWTPRIIASVGVDIPMVPTREQVLLLEPPSDFREEDLDQLPTGSAPDTDWYLRPDFGEGVLIATHYQDDETDPDTYDPSPDEETLLYLLEELESFAPRLADSKIRGQYCGVYSTTPDLDFVIDQVGPDGCYVACGFSGHGFKHGPAVGKILTDLLTEGDTDLIDVDYFSLARFEDEPSDADVTADTS